MLKLRYLFENYPLAKAALKNWDYDENTLEKLFPQFRISSNAIYPFSWKGGIRFLRLAPVDEKCKKNIFGELEFISYLNGNGFPALKPLEAKTGEKIKILDTEWGKYYASAFECVAGEQIEDTNYSDGVMYEYGKTLGRLHALSSVYSPKIRKWDYEEALDWAQKTLCEYHAPEYVLAELDPVKKELSLLPKDAQHYGLVHYDFEPDNVFYDEQTKTCSVIDFDDGMYHWYALDFEQVFDAVSGEMSEDAFKTAKACFISGYKTEFAFDSETEKLLPLMRRFCNIYSCARLKRCVDERFNDEPDWMTQLRVKLDRRISDLEQGMRG